MASKNLENFGHVNSVDVSSNTTVSLTAHSSILVNVTATCTITLPAVATAHRWMFRVGAEGITLTISPNASDLIAGAGAANSGAGADDKDVIFTSQPAGSYIVLDYMDANGYSIVRSYGTYTFQA